MSDHLEKMRNEREEFLKGNLSAISHSDPAELFNEWYKDAFHLKCKEPHAFVLSTCVNNQPSSRILYMRDLADNGFTFFTNYLSQKGEEIDVNNKVAALFYWDCAERQVRIEGTVEMADSKVSDDYFASRPRGSQVGAWASEQSKEIPARATLDERVKFFEEKFPGTVPRPPHWGGYIIRPSYFEFWQGRLSRLHDRICFEKSEKGWRTYRISP